MSGSSLPTLELGGIVLGVREGVIVLISLVAIYMVFVLLRVRRLRKPPETAAPVAPVLSDAAPGDAGAAAEVPGEPAMATDDSWQVAPPGLAEEVLRHGLEQEVAQLRDEVDALRGEVAALRDDLQQEMAHLRAAQTVSPIYGDAMQMAVAGYDPAVIAERCGIARAEAELVVALAKSQEH